MPTKALCPKCGNALVVTAEGTLRQHGSCGKVPVEKAAGTVEVTRKPAAKKTATATKTSIKRVPAKKASPAKKKAAARRK